MKHVHPCIKAASVLIALVALIGPTLAQAPSVERLDVIRAGFFVFDPAGARNDAPEAVGGIVIRPTNMRFLAETPAVTASKGTSFGVRFFVVGGPGGADVTFRSVWKIPPPGMTDPKSGKNYRESATEFTTQIGTAYLDGYGFNEPWEIVKGTWTQQIWFGDRKLLEREYSIR